MNYFSHKSRIGYYFFKWHGFAVFIIILLIIITAGCALLALIPIDTNIGFAQFDNSMHRGQYAYLTVNKDDVIVFATTKSENGILFCCYSFEGKTYVFSVSSDVYDAHFSEEASDTNPYTLRGTVQNIESSLAEAIEYSSDLAGYRDTIGSVYLDASFPVTFPYKLPLLKVALITMLITIVMFIILQIDSFGFLYSIAISIDPDEGCELLERELASPYNIYINKNILITESFCLIRNRHTALYIPSSVDITIKPHKAGKKTVSETLYIHTKDGKKIKIIKSNCRNGKSTAQFMYTVLSKKRI